MVQMLESKGVGQSWNDWVCQKDTRLAKSRDLCKDRGLTHVEMVNVSVDRNSSFDQIVSVVNTYIPIFPLEILSRKPKPKCSVEKNPSFDGFRAQEISRKLFQILIDPVKDVLKGSKLIVVPDRQLFFAPFPSLVDENGCFLTSKYSIQITPSLHTLKASMQRANEPNFGFALWLCIY